MRRVALNTLTLKPLDSGKRLIEANHGIINQTIVGVYNLGSNPRDFQNFYPILAQFLLVCCNTIVPYINVKSI